MTMHKVTVEVEFYADMKDEMEGDDQADEIGDQIARYLSLSGAFARLGVAEDSFKVVDWMQEPVE